MRHRLQVSMNQLYWRFRSPAIKHRLKFISSVSFNFVAFSDLTHSGSTIAMRPRGEIPKNAAECLTSEQTLNFCCPLLWRAPYISIFLSAMKWLRKKQFELCIKSDDCMKKLENYNKLKGNSSMAESGTLASWRGIAFKHASPSLGKLDLSGSCICFEWINPCIKDLISIPNKFIHAPPVLA